MPEFSRLQEVVASSPQAAPLARPPAKGNHRHHTVPQRALLPRIDFR